MRGRVRPSWGLLAAAVAVVALTPVVAHAYLGTFSRYLADDFCTANTLRRFGFLGSQIYWYQSWSARYSYVFVVSVLQMVGPRLTAWLPAIALVGWVAAVAGAAWRALSPRVMLGVAVAIGAVHAFCTLAGAPNVYQSVYWETGMVTYTLPLILSIVYGTWLSGHLSSGAAPRSLIAAMLVSAGAAFALGGFSETYAALQMTALTLSVVIVPALLEPEGRSRARWVIGAGIGGTVLSIGVMLAAPGTAIRQALMPAHPGLPALTAWTLRAGYLFVARTVHGSPEAIVLSILIPVLLVFLVTAGAERGKGRRGWVPLLLLPILTPILMLSTIAPYEYAVSSYPDERVLITTMFVLVSGLVLWGGSLGRLVAARWVVDVAVARRVAGVATILVAIGLLAVSVRATAHTLGSLPIAQGYAQAWDSRDRDLREASHSATGVVPAASLRHMGGLAEIGRDPQEWINRCVAGTYGLDAVVAK